MRLAIKFSPGGGAGSQHTFGVNLIRSIYELTEDVAVFTSADHFPGVPGSVLQKGANPLLERNLPGVLRSWLKQEWTFARMLQAQRCDVLLCPFHEEAVTRIGGIPQVLVVHDLRAIIFPRDFPRMNLLWRLVLVPAIRRAAAVITGSEHSRRDILNYLKIAPEKVFVVPCAYNLIDRPGPTPTSRQLGKYILYVSSAQYPQKNLRHLLTAFSTIRKSLPHKLVIVGRPVPRFEKDVLCQISRLGLADSVVMLRDLTDEDLMGVYRGADVFVYPSYFEGFGVPPLEAMHYGIPVVASNATSIPEVCGKAAYYVDPHSPDSIAAGIAKVIADRELRHDLIARGFQQIQQYTWSRTAALLLDVCTWAYHAGAGGRSDSPRPDTGFEPITLSTIREAANYKSTP